MPRLTIVFAIITHIIRKRRLSKRPAEPTFATMRTVVAMALGGAAGALLRYGLSHLIQSLTTRSIPLGTFTVNIVGCLLLGFCFIWLDPGRASPPLRLGVQVGLLGAMTTFSTYSLETFGLLAEHRYPQAAAYALGSVAVGLAACYAGIVIGRSLFQP